MTTDQQGVEVKPMYTVWAKEQSKQFATLEEVMGWLESLPRPLRYVIFGENDYYEESYLLPKSYRWTLICSSNPNKAWIFDRDSKKKISALMSTACAKRIVAVHNQSIGYVTHKKEKSHEA